MLDISANAIKNVLAISFERVLGLYDEINMGEHKNESLCFVGIDGYKFSEPITQPDSVRWRSETKYLIKALGTRTTDAETLCGLIDDTVVPSLKAVSGVSEIKRGEAQYLREQGRYCVTCELIFCEKPASAPVLVPQIDFSVGGTPYSCMNSFTVSHVVKTGETPTLGNGIRSRIVGTRPAKITVKGEWISSVVSTVYSGLSQSLGSVITGGISVGGAAFSGVAMTGLSLDVGADGFSKITVEFTEVNET